jgi:hypothetical protein
MASSGTNARSQHPALTGRPTHIPEEADIHQRDVNYFPMLIPKV